MALSSLILGFFLSQAVFAEDPVSVVGCTRQSLNGKTITQEKAFDTNQILFRLGRKPVLGGDAVDVLIVTYGNYCRVIAGTIETDLNEAVPVAIEAADQYLIKLDVGMRWNMGHQFRKVAVIVNKNGTTSEDAIRIWISKLP